jgi:hypothetical protein
MDPPKNDDEREAWVWNDEGLYALYQAWCRHTGRESMRAYVRLNRALIDDAIAPVLAGEKRAHHLIYG